MVVAGPLPLYRIIIAGEPDQNATSPFSATSFSVLPASSAILRASPVSRFMRYSGPTPSGGTVYTMKSPAAARNVVFSATIELEPFLYTYRRGAAHRAVVNAAPLEVKYACD